MIELVRQQFRKIGNAAPQRTGKQRNRSDDNGEAMPPPYADRFDHKQTNRYRDCPEQQNEPQRGDLREHHETEHREKGKNQQSGCDPVWSPACTKPHSSDQERDGAGNINDANISGRKKPETKHNRQYQDSKTEGNQAFLQVALLCNVIPILMRCICRPVRIQTNRKSCGVIQALHYSRPNDAVIRVYDEAGNVIETHEHAGEFKEWWSRVCVASERIVSRAKPVL